VGAERGDFFSATEGIRKRRRNHRWTQIHTDTAPRRDRICVHLCSSVV
jgi:hypothetical protein